MGGIEVGEITGVLSWCEWWCLRRSGSCLGTIFSRSTPSFLSSSQSKPLPIEVTDQLLTLLEDLWRSFGGCSGGDQSEPSKHKPSESVDVECMHGKCLWREKKAWEEQDQQNDDVYRASRCSLGAKVPSPPSPDENSARAPESVTPSDG